jgi:glutathione peroxidase
MVLPETQDFPQMSRTSQNVYEFSAPLLAPMLAPLPADLLVSHLEGQPLSLSYFQGRVLLIVNTASLCGFTPQYAGLEALYRIYRERGLTVLGFPCNQFGAQEPGTETGIVAFCMKNYGVTFPMFAKVEVNGPNAHPLYVFLKKEKPGLLGFLGSGNIRWNFTKFLVDRKGRVAARYGPAREPKSLAAAIERLLNQDREPAAS